MPAQNGSSVKAFETVYGQRAAAHRVSPGTPHARLGRAWRRGEYATLWSMDVDGSPIGFGVPAPGVSPLSRPGASGATLRVWREPALSAAQQGSRRPTTARAAATSPYALPHAGQNIWQWSLAVEHRLPGNMTAGSRIRRQPWIRLQFQADINQVPANKLGGGQLRGHIHKYLGIGPLSRARSTAYKQYFELRAPCSCQLQKQMGFGLLANVNFTWSKMLDDQDTSGWGRHYGDAYYQDAYNPRQTMGRRTSIRPDC